MRATRAIAAAWGLGACAASVALAAAAQTEQPRATLITLHWTAPVGCPDELSVRDDVQRLLSGSQASGTARADVTHTGDSWRVVVSMNGGERRLEAASCRALADATALIVAMAVDPARVVANRASQSASVTDAGSVDSGAAMVAVAPSGTPDAPDAPDAAAATSTATPPNSTPTPIPTRAATETPPPPAAVLPSPPRRETRFAASAALASDVGSLPTAALGASAAFAWTPAPFRIELSGAYFFPSSTPTTTFTLGPSSAYARFTLLAAALRACWSFHAASFEGGPCLEGEVTSLRGTGIGQGQGFDPTSGSSGWFAPGGELFGAWRFVRNVGVIARADALIPTIRPKFQVEGATLRQPGIVTARLSLGVELRF
jgi:hypothetical protein